MSRSPYFFVERFDRNTGKYEMQHPIVWNYNHTKQEPADLFPYNGCHDLFSIVEDNSHDGLPEMRGIHQGLPENVAKEIKENYDQCCYETEYAGEKHLYTPVIRWFSYADMYIYCLEHPKVIDYEAMDYEGENTEKIFMPTPMKKLKERVDAFLEVMDGWDWRDDFSQIRIVYWIE